MLTQSEENYLKVIYKLSGSNTDVVTTNTIADALNTKAASTTAMIKKLSKKGLLNYHKYQGVSPSPSGKKEALKVIRKHRLWEVFLVRKLKFNWQQVHEVAEQLEHIESPMLIEHLDTFLGHPKYDPHGDPIPNANGEMEAHPTVTISQLKPGEQCTVICAKDASNEFLLYLDKISISLGAEIKILDYLEFDGSFSVSVNDCPPVSLSSKVAENIYIERS
jgi:DtxR family transcriptional regulator, Mn-dependent transcriptional regulator